MLPSPADLAAAAVVMLVLMLAFIAGVWCDFRRTGGPLDLYFGWRALWLYGKLWHGVRWTGRDPLPPRGPLILVSNHTSASDPLLIQCCSRRMITFLMAREYYDLKWLRPIYNLSGTILVRRDGRDTAAAKAALRALGEGRVIGLFPEGGIQLDPAALGDPKPGAAALALLARVPVVPVFVDRPLHTKRLLRGLFGREPTRIVFGEPIDLRSFAGRTRDDRTLNEVSVVLMQAIAALRPGEPSRGHAYPKHRRGK